MYRPLGSLNPLVLAHTRSASSQLARRSFEWVDRALVESQCVEDITSNALVVVIFLTWVLADPLRHERLRRLCSTYTAELCETLAFSASAVTIAAVRQFDVDVGAVILDEEPVRVSIQIGAHR